jgi:hypothetical protein
MTMIVAAILIPRYFFFPATIGYIAYGVGKTLVLGFFERLPERDPLLDEEYPDEAGEERREIDYGEIMPPRGRFRLPGYRRRLKGRRRTDLGKPSLPPPEQTKGESI